MYATHLSVEIWQLQDVPFENDCNRQMTLKYVTMRLFGTVFFFGPRNPES